MKKKRFILSPVVMTALASLMLAASLFSFSDADRETLKIMPFMSDFALCLECHRRGEVEAAAANAMNGCDRACLTCHGDMEPHHRTGMEVDFEVPRFIVLMGKKKLACVSCHDLTRSRYDSKSWRSESLFGKLFKSGSRFKTYYLVQNNSSGELCKVCH